MRRRSNYNADRAMTNYQRRRPRITQRVDKHISDRKSRNAVALQCNALPWKQDARATQRQDLQADVSDASGRERSEGSTIDGPHLAMSSARICAITPQQPPIWPSPRRARYDTRASPCAARLHRVRPFAGQSCFLLLLASAHT